LCRLLSARTGAARRTPVEGRRRSPEEAVNARARGAVLRRSTLSLWAALLTLAGGCRAPANQPEEPVAEAKTTRRDGSIVVTVVYDNYPYDKRLQTAWGFACVVTGAPKTILFDTGGDGRILLANMRACGIKPDEIEAVVLSHVHADHTGGLEAFLQANHNVTVYMPQAFPEQLKRLARTGGGPTIAATRPWNPSAGC
jgi:hypothetical protein